MRVEMPLEVNDAEADVLTQYELFECLGIGRGISYGNMTSMDPGMEVIVLHLLASKPPEPE